MKAKTKAEFKRKIQNIIIFGFIGAMVLLLLAPAFTVKAEGTEKLAVHFIDVGQGDATLITLDDSTTDGIDHAMLIDGGNYEDASKMYSYMTSYGLTNLDYMIATCTDEDHVGGLCGALAYSTPAVVLAPVATSDAHDYTTFTDALDKKFLTITVPEVGSEYSFGNASFKVLAPATPGDGNAETGSIVIRFTYQNNSFLFMSDAGIDEEHTMVSSFDAAALKSDVIKVGTHGASRSTSDELLEAVAPSYAIISVGANNEYGYPASDTLTKFANREIPVIRTDNSGDIIITSDGTNLSFDTQKDTAIPSTSSGTTNGESSSTAPSLSVTPEEPGTEEEGLARYNDVLRMMQALMDASTDTSNISVDYFNTCMAYLAAYPIPIRQSAYVNASAAITSSAQMSNELAEACFYYLYHAELISNSDESLRDSAKIAEDTSRTMAELYQSQGVDVFYGRTTYSVSDLLDGNPYYSDMNPENDKANGTSDNTTTEPQNVSVTTDSRTTGDTSNMMLYIVMVVVSLLLFTVVGYSSLLEGRKRN